MFARLRTNFSGSASASYSCLNSDNLANWSGAGKYWKKWDGISVGNDGENINSIKYEPRSRLDLLSDSSIMQGNGIVSATQINGLVTHILRLAGQNIPGKRWHKGQAIVKSNQVDTLQTSRMYRIYALKQENLRGLRHIRHFLPVS